jgi:hypothetical protein
MFSCGVMLMFCGSDIVGMAYPIWASYKAIESPQPDDDTQWYALSFHLFPNATSNSTSTFYYILNFSLSVG